MKKEFIQIPKQTLEREPMSDDFFLSRNVVKLFGEINDENANYVISSMHYLTAMFETNRIPFSEQEINLWINSPGGSVPAGFAIYDTMKYINCDIRTTCIGTAASMAALLLAAGTKGKREALPHSSMMIHQPRGGTQGPCSDVVIFTKQIQRTDNTQSELLALSTGKSIEQIKIDTERDYYMTAEEALQYGLIDRIITTRAIR